MNKLPKPPRLLRSDRIFADWAEPYRAAGYWPRPIAPGSKACKEPGWQLSDPEQKPTTLEGWDRKCPSCGLGLLMGSPFPDGTFLGAIDIDRNEYVNLGKALLQNPICGRVGQKGAVFFVRVVGVLGNPEFKVKGPQGESWGKVAECLFRKKLCVIPPTIHPVTNSPYRWLGKPLLEVDYTQLPIVEK